MERVFRKRLKQNTLKPKAKSNLFARKIYLQGSKKLFARNKNI